MYGDAIRELLDENARLRRSAEAWEAEALRYARNTADAQNNRDRLRAALDGIRDTVLHGRGPLEGDVLDSDQTNAVLAVIDNACTAETGSVAQYSRKPVKPPDDPPEGIAAALRREVEPGGLYARPAAPASDAHSVRIPTTADEAAMMVLLGTEWLKQHAPERLRASAPPPPAPAPLPGPAPCSECHGARYLYNNDVRRVECDVCEGTGVEPPLHSPPAPATEPEPEPAPQPMRVWKGPIPWGDLAAKCEECGERYGRHVIATMACPTSQPSAPYYRDPRQRPEEARLTDTTGAPHE